MQIIEKYKSFNSKEIQSGYRSKTFLLSNNDIKYIYQTYRGNTKYQARKKEHITNLIKESIDIDEIPSIIECDENEEFSYLVSEYKEGKELEELIKDEKYDYKRFYNSLAIILEKIHSIEIGNKFGWIGKNGLVEKQFFHQYIEDEVQRNIERIEKYDKEKLLLESITKKANTSLEKLKSFKNIRPVISWYDINSNNILVNEQSKITGFLDPGGARFAPKEWDLAFIKMDLCRSKEEYKYFKNAYLQQNILDEELLEILTIIVEIDDIAFQLETGVKLPIAFETNFRKELEYIHKNI